MEGHTDGGVIKQPNNKWFIVTLSVLGAVIVGLIIAIIIVSINKNSTNQISDNPVNEQPTETTSSTEMTEAEQTEFETFMEAYDRVTAEAQTVLSRETVSAADIMGVYTPTINGYLSKGDYADAQTFILLRNDTLLSQGFNQEALDALTSLDYSVFPAYMQNRYYNRIIRLATELGDNDTISKYTPLAAATEAAARAAGEASAKWTEEMTQLPGESGGQE